MLRLSSASHWHISGFRYTTSRPHPQNTGERVKVGWTRVQPPWGSVCSRNRRLTSCIPRMDHINGRRWTDFLFSREPNFQSSKMFINLVRLIPQLKKHDSCCSHRFPPPQIVHLFDWTKMVSWNIEQPAIIAFSFIGFILSAIPLTWQVEGMSLTFMLPLSDQFS